MKILMINKFLHPNGGSETYIFKLGQELERQGHEVQYFGMDHEKRCVGNRVEAYTSNMDFHGGSKLAKLTYPIKTIYSSEARKKIRLVLDDFQPDVCHLNNFNYQLTPSIILEIRKWEKQSGHKVKIIFTAHDYQLICPNHMLRNPNTQQNCEKCLGGHFFNCTKGKCIHGSTAKSIIGTVEAMFWNRMGVYKQLDTIICCSNFLKTKMDTNPVFAEKTVAMHNFIDKVEWQDVEKEDYVLYFGRFSEEKGTDILLEACKVLPDISFVFAGTGPMEDLVRSEPNVKCVGFKTGDELDMLIRKARFSLCTSVVHENCPFSVMESQVRGTPVIGAKVGGVPELIEDGVTGRLFECANVPQLANAIRELWSNPETVRRYAEKCQNVRREDLTQYSRDVLQMVGGVTFDVIYAERSYALYFGRFSEEKGIRTLIAACKQLPDIQFVFAGNGPMEEEIDGVPNIKNVGFQKGDALENLIRGARFSVYPSEWYENCPFSVMESQMYGTPVVGADIGGIPELVEDGVTGRLFAHGNVEMLTNSIKALWDDMALSDRLQKNCQKVDRADTEQYCQSIMQIYS